jgi:alkylhydroperoxidase family enzyme
LTNIGDRPNLAAVALVDPIPFDALDGELREMLAPRVERLGYLGEFFQLAAHQPDALAGFVRFTESLKAALPWRLVEIAALTVAGATENDYERVQHERLARKLGMSEEEVRAIGAGAVAPPLFAAAEVATAELAHQCALATGRDNEANFVALRDATDQDTAVGLLLVCSRYLAHANFVNTMGIGIPAQIGAPTHA